MNIRDLNMLTKQYADCPECGSDNTGIGEGTFEVEGEIFRRTCKCGFAITVDKRIKIIASHSMENSGIYEVRIDDNPSNKLLPANELKALAGVKRINQYQKVETWLNTPVGRKWALETPSVENFK